MTTFYKYTSNFGPSYFIKPTVKLSNPSYLNDPFESEASDNIIDVTADLYKDGDVYQIKKEDIKGYINTIIKHNGIFSVSETPRNSLMWAHYADQHHGLCIGLDEDIFSECTAPRNFRELTAEYKPRKVNYDNYRFDRQTEISSREDVINSIKTSLLTKSDDWIYEKEHRWIIPFRHASHFKIDKKSKSTNSIHMPEADIDYFINESLAAGYIEEVNAGTYKYSKEIDDIYIAALASFGCIVFLFDINPKHIKSIHIGLRVTNKETIDIYNVIHNPDHDLSHIKIMKFRLSTNRFELLPDLVDEAYIAKLLKE